MSANAQTSTGLRNAALAAWKTALDHGFLKIYGGTVPATADAALGAATLLCTISVNSTGTGITLAATPVAGVLQKNGSEIWSGVNAATGTASFYRFVAAADSGAASTTEPRIQGTVGVTGEGLNLTMGTALAATVTTTIDSFATEVPTF